MDNTINLYFKWYSATPDPRQFNQQRQVMFPFVGEDEDSLISTVIAIRIPCTHEYVFNAPEIITAQLSSDEDVPDALLTPAGMFLAISLLESPFVEVDKQVEDEKKKLDDEWGDDDGWGKDDQEGHPWDTKAEVTPDPPPDDTPKPVESKPADDSWEDAISTDETKEDESSDDVPDWTNEETWETKTEKGE